MITTKVSLWLCVPLAILVTFAKPGWRHSGTPKETTTIKSELILLGLDFPCGFGSTPSWWSTQHTTKHLIKLAKNEGVDDRLHPSSRKRFFYGTVDKRISLRRHLAYLLLISHRRCFLPPRWQKTFFAKKNPLLTNVLSMDHHQKWPLKLQQNLVKCVCKWTFLHRQKTLIWN